MSDEYLAGHIRQFQRGQYVNRGWFNFLILSLCCFYCWSVGAQTERTEKPPISSANHLSYPQRIISLSPHLTEMLFAIGAGDQVVGVDSASDYPESVKTLPKVANYQSLNMESLLQLNPDLVIGWQSTQQKMKPQLDQFHINNYFFRSQQLSDLPKELRQLGQLTGHEQSAETLATHITQQLETRKNAAQHLQQHVKVFYQLWYSPLMTVAKGSYVEEILELCGADNPFANSPTSYPQVSIEAVLSANPDIIFATKHGQHLQDWLQWPSLNAVKKHQLYLLNADWLHRLTPRILLGIDQVCQYTQPQSADQILTITNH